MRTAALYGSSIRYLLKNYSVRIIIELYEEAYKMKAELAGAELKDEWKEEDRKKAREELYTPEEIKEMESALNGDTR